ncbi:MAG: hypothetical protein HY516_03805 [Candidatus Aenigmarchaeota archaeon]|nr:hypothetical protein [Candidatus Aenigmarchaeota archaeon]
MDLNECFRKGFIKKTIVNKELVKSLIEMSDTRGSVVKAANITKTDVSVYVSLAYDSLREVLEALCVLNGYKVLSHMCVGELLDSVVKNFDYDSFDRFRWIRNGINYYGEKIDFEQGKEVIAKIFAMKDDILKNYLKNI